jgi:hypothetical protein
MLQILWKMRGFNSKKHLLERQLKWQLPAHAATSKENVQKKRIQEKIPKRKKISPKTIPDPFLSG